MCNGLKYACQSALAPDPLRSRDPAASGSDPVLLDQAVVAELNSPYGGYPTAAVVGIGAAWLVMTLLVAIVLSLIGSTGRT